MRNLMSYFRQELQLLAQQGKYFSRRFPGVAQALGMSKGNFDDPHTARLMESFALLTAQLHQRLDEDVPEIANGVMQNLAPQLLRSFPSSCIVQFQPDVQQGGMTQVRNIPAGFELQSNPIDGQTCRFLTHYPLRIWPARVDDACLAQSHLDDTWQLRLSVQPWPGSVIRENHLRVWLEGSEELVHTLLAQLCAHVQHITVRHAGKRFDLPVQRLRHVGFEQDELLLHKQARTAPTHGLMLDFAQFAQRFHFLDLPLPEKTSLAGPEPLEWEITFRRNWMAPALAAIAPLVSAANFQINCTPALNLFACRAEPITLQSQVDEHPVIADMKNQKSVVFWAIESVRLRQVKGDEAVTTILSPLLGLEGYHVDAGPGLHWQLVQRELLRKDGAGIGTFIAFSDRRPLPHSELAGVVMLEILCTNGALPTEMANGHPDGDFVAPAELPGMTINALTRPSAPVHPPQGTASVWRLVSQLTLNHLLLSDQQGCQYLKHSLSLYNLSHCPRFRQAIELVRDLQMTSVHERLIASDPHSTARGLSITVSFATQARTFGYYTLFCCFLDHLLGLYAPVNGFSRLTTCIEGVEESRQQWPIRAGRLSWL